MIYDSYDGKCVCKEGYNFNKRLQRCEICLHFRGNCVEHCPVFTKENIETKECIKIKHSLTDNVLLYWICGLSIIALVCII